MTLVENERSNRAPRATALSPYARASDGTFDEAFAADGQSKLYWTSLLHQYGELGIAECRRRAERITQQVRLTGIAHDLFADPNANDASWSLDLAPVVFSSHEWADLSRAIVQRAHLYDRLIGDLYNDRTVLEQNLIPPELVFADPTYLRQCEGVVPKSGALSFYAADIARESDGRWRIIDNHTETLAGIGVALANRVVHSHVSGDIFHGLNAHRLSFYFESLSAELRQRSGRDDPRIALLTPGPHHPDYFSHAYVARYLGLLLVEGLDLRTQDDGVYIKTLEGLQAIDLIVRCTEGRFSDPLYLDQSGFQGPPALVDACRARPGLIGNALGSAIAQNRGLSSYLPEVAKALLGEDLLIDDVRQLWLGDAAQRAHVLQNLSGYIIQEAQEQTGRPGQAARGRGSRSEDDPSRAALIQDIQLFARNRIAQEALTFSTSPAFDGDGFVPRPFAVRVFATRIGDTFQVMPGGLAMTIGDGAAVALNAADGRARDVWVLSETSQDEHPSLWRPTVARARVERSHRAIQSRVADNLFWLGRFAERADWTMRVMRSSLRRVEEDSGLISGRRAARRCLSMLIAPTGATGAARSSADSTAKRPVTAVEIENLCRKILTGNTTERAMSNTLSGIYRNAAQTRDRLSLEAWRALSDFQPGGPWHRDLISERPLLAMEAMETGLASLAAFNGLMHENMTRNYGWSFLDAGRRIERAYNLAEAFLSLFVPAPLQDEEHGNLFMLLELADSFITYRSRYRLDPMLPLVVDLLLLDESNPRSLAYQLARTNTHLSGLPDAMQGVTRSNARRIALSLLTEVQLLDIDTVASQTDRRALAEAMKRQIDGLPDLSDALTRQYFNLLDDTPKRAGQR
ncbi:MAG: circularly permuted type 2 ATP-grasp protein [Pseudomonadota bacterium]